MSLYRYNHQQ